MKSKLNLLFALGLLLTVYAFSQSPNSFKYQAMLRKADGSALANQSVNIKIHLLKGSITGASVYSETHSVNSNTFGIIDLNIGEGSAKSGLISTIDWSYDSYYIKIEMDENGGTNFKLYGVSQLLSVPYALFAKTAGNGFSGDYTDLINTPNLSDTSKYIKSDNPKLDSIILKSQNGKIYSLKVDNFGNLETSDITINKVLILGNSITKHGPAPEIGWYGDWGMAASAESKDYVHLMIHKFTEQNPNIEVNTANIAMRFEAKFWNFDTIDFYNYKTYSPDLIIMRFGENVNDIMANSDSLNYHLSQLIDYIKGNNNSIICCTNCFWPNTYINNEIFKSCIRNNYDFVDISTLWADSTNAAFGLFSNHGVAIHPSDYGMQNIADRIWMKIKKYF